MTSRRWFRRPDAAGVTGYSLVTSTVLTAVLGVAYWALAARLYPPEVVGRDAALISFIMAMATFCQLNFNNSVLRLLPQVRTGLRRLVLNVYGAVVVLAVLSGALVVTLATKMSGRLQEALDERLLPTAVVVALVFWCIFTLQDDVATALARAWWVPVENLAYSIAKLVLLLALTNTALRSHGVVAAWFLPCFIVVPVVNFLLYRAARDRATGPIGLDLRNPRLRRYLYSDLVGSTALQLSAASLPLIVVALIGVTQNAYFYVAYMMVTTFDLVLHVLVASVTTEASRTPARVNELVRSTVLRVSLLLVPAMVAMLVLAPFLLRIYGPEYADEGTDVLRVLVLASLPRTVQFGFSAAARLRGDGNRLLVVQLANAVLLVTFISSLGAQYGLTGVGVGWLLAHALLGLAVLPYVIKFVRQPTVLEVDSQSRLDPQRQPTVT